jgi:hypothetical protein
LNATPQELRQLLDKQAAESSAALSAERLEAAHKAEGSAAAAVDAAQAAAASALHAAEVRVALLEGQLEVVEQERDLLQQQVRCCDCCSAALVASQATLCNWWICCEARSTIDCDYCYFDKQPHGLIAAEIWRLQCIH